MPGENSMTETSPNRRTVIRAGAATLAVAAGAAALAKPHVARSQVAGPHQLPKLPYDDFALAPVISSETIGFHYGKHHAGYLTNLNNLLAQARDLAALSLEDLVKTTSVNPARRAIFNNAAQVWNHTFYWNSMRPNGGGEPAGKVKDQIAKDFGDYAKFRAAFRQMAITQFASGWAWLAWNERDKKLVVLQTPNADTPVHMNLKPILTIDVWEHAYYIDFRNDRARYVDAFLDKLVNWEFAAKNLG
jgi:Fe-Mn family superoxide dismutase